MSNSYRHSHKRSTEKTLILMGKKLDKLENSNNQLSQINLEHQEKIKELGNIIDAHMETTNNHIALIANFARHDITNYIQNMDAILCTTNIKELLPDVHNRLLANINSIREVMSNFASLVPHSQDGVFSVTQLLGAAEALNRDLLVQNKIRFFKDYPELDITMRSSFQLLLQVIVNLINNACKEECYLEGMAYDKMIKLSYELSESNFLKIRVFDNGLPIPEDKIEKIFFYGFSETGGSGIGLFHARYLCGLLKGRLLVENSTDDIYTKCFCIELPIERLENV